MNAQTQTDILLDSPTVDKIHDMDNTSGIQNRKILEDLELKKQILLKTGAVPTPPTASHPTTPGTSDSHFQRAQALQSTGFFITTDSAFGNSILPVLPRFEK